MDALQKAKLAAERIDEMKSYDRASAMAAEAAAYAAIAQAESMERALPILSRQADAMERVAMHLGNIHQTLMTPDANGEPTFVSDLLKRIADATAAREPSGRGYGE